jgi:hypothetical protein
MLACPSAKYASYLYTANLNYVIFFVPILGTSLYFVSLEVVQCCLHFYRNYQKD